MLAIAGILVGCRRCDEEPEREDPTGTTSAEGTAEPSDEGTGEGAEPEPNLWDEWDPEAEAAALQGRWVVPDASGRERTAWRFDGDTLAIVNAREEVRAGTFEIAYPGRILWTRFEHRTSVPLSYSRNRDHVYLGISNSGLILGGRYVAHVNENLVIFNGVDCNVFPFVGGVPAEEAIPVSCRVEEEYGETTFHFDLPGEPPVPHSLNVVGTALLDSLMIRNRAYPGDEFRIDARLPEQFQR
jgi:hypothetical protein